MIVRLRKSLIPLALISKTKANSTVLIQPEYYHSNTLQRQSQKLQKCKSIKDVLKLSYHKEILQINDLQEIFKKIAELKQTAKDWDGYSHLINKVLDIDKQYISESLLENICNVIDLMNQHLSYGCKVYHKLTQRVEQLLQKHINLTNNQIISYMKLAYEIKNYQLVQKLMDMLDSRAEQMNSKQIINYLGFIKRRFMLLKSQKQLLNKIISQISKDSDILNMNTRVLYYIELKNINKKLFKKTILLDQLQKQIIENIQTLSQKQLKLLLNNISERNPVTCMILRKILTKICNYQDGKTNVQDVQPIFQLLAEVSEVHNIGLQSSQENQQKITNFFIKNLKYSNEIVSVIQNNFFRQSNLVEIHQHILKNNLTEYLGSYRYLYEALNRGLVKSQKYELYVTNLLTELPTMDSNVYFMKNAIIVKKLHANLIQNNSLIDKVQDQYKGKVKEALDYFIRQITQIKEDYTKLKYFSKYIRNKRVLQQFNANFKQIYLQKIEEMANSQQYFNKLFTFFYFLYAEDGKTLFWIIKKNPNFIENNMVKIILSRVKLNAANLQNSYGIFFGILLKIEISDYNKKLLQQMLCKQQIHNLLKPEQISIIMRLCTKLIKQWPKKNSVFAQFVNQVISFNDIIHRCQKQYLQFLEQVQNKICNNNYKYFGFFPLTYELKRLNIMKPEIAQKIIQYSETLQIFKNYGKVVINKDIEWNKLDINQQNLLLIFKADPFLGQKLSKIQPLIINQILKSNSYMIEEFLLNFQMDLNDCTNLILSQLFTRYSQLITSYKMKLGLKAGFILRSFANRDMKHIQSYRNFLTTTMNHIYEKNIDKYHITSYIVLIEQCLKYNVNSQKFVQKIVNLTYKKQFKNNNFQNDMVNFLRTILSTLSPKVQQRIIYFIRKHCKNQDKLRLLPFIAIFIHPQKQCIDELKFLIENIQKNKDQIPQGIIKYLTSIDGYFNKYLKKQKAESELQSKWLSANLNNLLSNNDLSYEPTSRYEHKAIRLKGKIIACVSISYNQNINLKLKQFYSKIYATDTSNIIVLYAYPFKTSQFINAQILCKQFQHLNLNKEQVTQYLRKKQYANNQTQSAQTHLLKNSIHLIKNLIPKISHIL